jgi:2-dehydro-3-deoxyphosphogluconate aldolase/(4S)-4-hydroxy-2-oxoglutarate aldolase
MTKVQALKRIREAGVVPVVRALTAPEALTLAEALVEGGLPVIEVAMTVPDAPRVIRRLVDACGDGVLIGAGSVLDVQAARECVAAGAKFIVSPALRTDVIAHGHRHGVAVIPGALTPTEIVAAWSAGADLIKVFPVGALGGASYVRALKAPMPHLDLLPTGGITLAAVPDYFAAGAVAVGAGSELLVGGAARVTAAARAWLEAARNARPARSTSLS